MNKPNKLTQTIFFTLIFISLLVTTGAVAKTDSNRTAEKPLTAYGQALTEHHRALGTWALYQGDDAVFKQTWLPSPNATGIVIAEDKQIHRYKIGSITKTMTTNFVRPFRKV